MGGGGSTDSSSFGQQVTISKSISDYFSDAFSLNTSNSQNTSESQQSSQNTSTAQNSSTSQNTSTSQQSSRSGTSESRLSQLQGDILQNRENQYNQYYFPELQKAMEEQSAGGGAFNASMNQQAGQINAAYDAAQKNTVQSLAQQGLAGNKNGVEAALTAANNRARSSSLAQAYANQLAQTQSNKNTLLALMGQAMPGTTNSAEYYQNAVSQGSSSSQGTSYAQGTSNSQGTSQGTSYAQGTSNSQGISDSHSEGHSKNSSTSWGNQGSQMHSENVRVI